MLSSSDTDSWAKVRNVFIFLHRDFGSNILFGFENSSAKKHVGRLFRNYSERIKRLFIEEINLFSANMLKLSINVDPAEECPMDVSPEDVQNIIHNPVLEANTITFEFLLQKPSKMEDT